MAGWLAATVVEIRDETPRARTFRLHLPEEVAHRPGQHCVIRLSAPDGYTASRSYSIASAPGALPPDEFEVTVERLDDGEVSGFLHDEVVVGDELEVRGPIGGWFVWDGDSPALLVGGGSGVVPLMAMIRAARLTDRRHLVRAVISVRSRSDLFYADEIEGPETSVVYTRSAPEGHDRAVGRMTAADLVAALPRDASGPAPIAYVCGSAGFADAATRLLEDVGQPTDRIRVERFGPTAG